MYFWRILTAKQMLLHAELAVYALRIRKQWTLNQNKLCYKDSSVHTVRRGESQ
jgi:hypothetical protein